MAVQLEKQQQVLHGQMKPGGCVQRWSWKALPWAWSHVITTVVCLRVVSRGRARESRAQAVMAAESLRRPQVARQSWAARVGGVVLSECTSPDARRLGRQGPGGEDFQFVGRGLAILISVGVEVTHLTGHLRLRRRGSKAGGQATGRRGQDGSRAQSIMRTGSKGSRRTSSASSRLARRPESAVVARHGGGALVRLAVHGGGEVARKAPTGSSLSVCLRAGARSVPRRRTSIHGVLGELCPMARPI